MRYVAFVFVSALLLSTSEKPESRKPSYVGAERCKLCHRSIYESWAKTAHRQATNQLARDDRSLDCLPCHATGPAQLPGVQCEACHGAGSFYSQPEIMIDPDKARAAGLIEPSESRCRTCHGNGLPNHSSTFSMPEGDDRLQAIHE